MACLNVQADVFHLTGVNMFDCMTLASLAMQVYQKLFVTELHYIILEKDPSMEPSNEQEIVGATLTILDKKTYNGCQWGGFMKIYLEDGK